MIITKLLLTLVMMHPWIEFMVLMLMTSMLIIKIMMIILMMIMKPSAARADGPQGPPRNYRPAA